MRTINRHPALHQHPLRAGDGLQCFHGEKITYISENERPPSYTMKPGCYKERELIPEKREKEFMSVRSLYVERKLTSSCYQDGRSDGNTVDVISKLHQLMTVHSN